MYGIKQIVLMVVTLSLVSTLVSNSGVTAAPKIRYDLTIAVRGSGTTSPVAGTYTYNEDRMVTITATPYSGWQFDSWAGDVANHNSASTTVVMDGDKTVTANFTRIAVVTYDMTIAVNGSGITSPPSGSHIYNSGTVVNITATPHSGWLFDSWSGGVADPKSANTTVVMDGDKTVTANFSAIADITYELTMAAIGNGITSPSAGHLKCNAGTVVNITATPDSGWMFFKWTGDVADPNSASTTVTMHGDKTVTANFTQTSEITHVLTIATNGNGITSPSIGSHRYNEEAVVDVIATPDSGWRFNSWSGNVADPNSANTTVVMDGDKTLTAFFTRITQSGEVGGCSCNSNGSMISAIELLIGWGIIGLCWGGGYYVVRRSGKSKI